MLLIRLIKCVCVCVCVSFFCFILVSFIEMFFLFFTLGAMFGL